MDTTFSIHDSGIRTKIKRRWKNFWHVLHQRIVPMKKNDRGEKVVDKSQVTWRSFQTAVGAFLTAATAWLIGHTGTDTQLAERLERRLSVQEANIILLSNNITALNSKVDFVMAFVNGAIKNPKL